MTRAYDGRVPFQDIDELVRFSDIAVVVTVEERLPDFWRPSPVQDSTTVHSVFSLRVDRVVAGDAAKPGEKLIVHLPGGVVADKTVPAPAPGVTISLKPEPGDKTFSVSMAGYPEFVPGTQEVVFLERFTPPAEWGIEPYYVTGPDSRFALERGLTRSIVAGRPPIDGDSEYDLVSPGLRAALEGKTLDELSSLVAGVFERRGPEPSHATE